MNVQTPVEQLKPADYASDQEVRWCPGCGDYAIVKSVQRTMAELQLAPENTVFISGIGCAARFPYYMATYGFHTIHGRAPAIATGTKLANPELDIWVVMGDGDCLSIGGNHTLHALRRNVDIQMLLFNNEIYGLTKAAAADSQIQVEHGKKLVFGKDGDRGLRLDPATLSLEVVAIGENGIGEDDILVHDETNRLLANLLGAMEHPEFPVAIGVLYCDPAETYDAAVHRQIGEAAEKTPPTDLNAMLRRGRTWTVAPG
ncbi:MAG: thiamine pyrophosphate-dependent enzyme [Defluviicoccus sp.]|nr:thiamine pyrophosphate-dependent enzyme [Defluviicoccus sp.]